MPGITATSYRPRQARLIPFKLPSPSKGMNTVDSLAAMSPEYAISATNFIAGQAGLTLRQGYQKYATGFTTPVTSLIPYNARSGSNKLFAVSGGNFYEISAGGAIGAAVVSGLSTTAVYWQSSAMSTPSVKNYIICVNGTDAPQLYDGSSWVACTQPASPAAPGQFSQTDNNGNAVNISDFIDVITHAERLWFVASSSTIAYYCDIESVGGTLYPFDFGPHFPRGGVLQKLASWTIDTGAGIDYILVAISNKGDVVLYTGNDPFQSLTFQLTGQYQLGAPVGQRCTFPLVGDLAYLSTDGLYPLSRYIQSPRVDIQSALTYAITPTIQSLISSWGSTKGWEMIIYPAQKLLLVNVPQGSQSANIQYCYSMINKGWTQFDSWPAQCFCLFNEQIYFGGTDFVGLAFQGYVDGDAGNTIQATALQAFSDCEYQGYKIVRGVKPYLLASQSGLSLSVGINTEFNLTAVYGGGTSAPATGALWGTAVWGQSTWGGAQSPQSEWFTPQCWPGEYIAATISLSANGAATWAATNFLIEPGQTYG